MKPLIKKGRECIYYNKTEIGMINAYSGIVSYCDGYRLYQKYLEFPVRRKNIQKIAQKKYKKRKKNQ
jgi:hypothetical protein